MYLQLFKWFMVRGLWFVLLCDGVWWILILDTYRVFNLLCGNQSMYQEKFGTSLLANREIEL